MAARSRLIAAFAAVYLIWGSTYLGIRIAIETMPPLLMAGVRYTIAGLLVYPVALVVGRESPRFVHWRSATVIGGLLLLGGNGAVSWSEQMVATGVAALLISTVPLWIVVLQWRHPGGEKPSGLVLVGVALGLLGLVLLMGPDRLISGPRPDPVGVAVLLLGALSWSVGSLHSRRAVLPRSPLLGIAMQMICGGILLVLAGFAIGEGGRLDIAGVSARSLVALLYLIFFGSLVGYTAYLWLLRVSSPAKVSTYAFVNPIVALVLGGFFAGEHPTVRTLVPAGIILAGVAIIILSRPRRE